MTATLTALDRGTFTAAARHDHRALAGLRAVVSVQIANQITDLPGTLSAIDGDVALLLDDQTLGTDRVVLYSPQFPQLINPFIQRICIDGTRASRLAGTR